MTRLPLVQDYKISLPDLAAKLGAELPRTPYVAPIEGLFAAAFTVLAA
jgi:hypothetical protein